MKEPKDTDLKEEEKNKDSSKFSTYDMFEFMLPDTQAKAEYDTTWLKDLMQNIKRPSEEDIEWINSSFPEPEINAEQVFQQVKDICSDYTSNFDLRFNRRSQDEKAEDFPEELTEIKSIFRGVQEISSFLRDTQSPYDFSDFETLKEYEFIIQPENLTEASIIKDDPLMHPLTAKFNSVFEKHLKGGKFRSINMSKCKILFHLANLSYEKSSSKLSKELEKLGFSLIEEHGHKKIDGYYACIVKKEEEIVICHRGTDTKSSFLNSKYFKQACALGAELKDINLFCAALYSDFQILFDKIPDQFAIADSFYQKTVDRYQGCKIIHTGHSLGGLLAELLGIKYGQEVISIDAPGTYMSFKKLLANGSIITRKPLEEEHKSLVTIFKSTPHAINCCGKQVRLPDYIIKFVDQTYEPNILDFWNFTLNQHNLDNIIENFEECKQPDRWPESIIQAFVNFLDPIHNISHWEKYSSKAWEEHKETIKSELSTLSKEKIEERKRLFQSELIISILVHGKKELKSTHATIEDLKFASSSEADKILIEKMKSLLDSFNYEVPTMGEDGIIQSEDQNFTQ